MKFSETRYKKILKVYRKNRAQKQQTSLGILDLEEDAETFPKHRENLVLSYS